MAKALGGEVVTDMGRAELGDGGGSFDGSGHAGPSVWATGPNVPRSHGAPRLCATRLPSRPSLLASSAKVENQAFTFPGKPIYCTQFHPELNRASLIERLRAYPKYVRTITGVSVEAFAEKCGESVGSDRLLKPICGPDPGSGRVRLTHFAGGDPKLNHSLKINCPMLFGNHHHGA